MKKMNIILEINDVEINEEIIKKYDLEDQFSFNEEAIDLAFDLKDLFKYPIKGEIIVTFELNDNRYVHLLP